MKKSIALFLATVCSVTALSDYLALIGKNNNKYEIKESIEIIPPVEPPVEPPIEPPIEPPVLSDSFTLRELYPFSSLILSPSESWASDGSRHYTFAKSYVTYVSPGNFSKINIKIPSEAGQSSNKRYNLMVSVNGVFGSSCIIPAGNYTLYYCNFELLNVKENDIIKMEAIGTANYTLIGVIDRTDEVFEVIHTK